MDWIKRKSGSEEAKGTLTNRGQLTYIIGNDKMDGAPIFAEFTGHFLFNTQIWRGSEIEQARHMCETHNNVWSNPA